MTATDEGRRGRWDVTSSGAAGDGETLDSPAIQAAVDDCAAAGGGTVHLPPGEYLAGTIALRDGVALHLDQSATLRGSPNVAEYGHPDSGDDVGLIAAQKATDVAILGTGTIDCNGAAYREDIADEVDPGDGLRQFDPHPNTAFERVDDEDRPGRAALEFDRCRDIRIQNVRIADAPRWTIHLLDTDDAAVTGVEIRNQVGNAETDGIGIDSSRNVRVSDCDILCGDDCVVLKSRRLRHRGTLPDRPVRNVTVTNCLFATDQNGLKIGTEVANGAENVTLSNTTITDPEAHPECDLPDWETWSTPISGVALESVDGGFVRNITVSNVVMQGADAPLFLRLGRRMRFSDDGLTADENRSVLRDISISNVVATGASLACPILGLPDWHIEDVSISDVRIETRGGRSAVLDWEDEGLDGLHDVAPDEAYHTVPERPAVYPEAPRFGPLPASGFYCRHVDDLTLRNVRVECRESDTRPVATAEDVTDCHFDGVRGAGAIAETAIVALDDVRRGIVRGVAGPEGTAGVRIDGAESAAIRVGDVLGTPTIDVGQGVEDCIVDD